MSFNPEYFFPTIITNIASLNGGQYGTVKATDIYPAVDVINLTQSPSGTTTPYQVVGLLNFILKTFGFVTYPSVLASTTANLTATYNNGLFGVGATLTNSGTQTNFVTDGQVGILNQFYQVAFQTAPAQNGLYQLTNIGGASINWILTRATYFNSSVTIVNNGLIYVLYGNTYGSTIWQETFSGSITVGTTAINFAQWTLP